MTEKWTRYVGTPLPVQDRTLVTPRPRTRELDEKGNLTWYDPHHCEHCKTTIVTEEAPYEFCSDCGCYTTVYVRKYMLDRDWVTLCQTCFKALLLLESGSSGNSRQAEKHSQT